MTIDERARKAIDLITSLRNELSSIVDDALGKRDSALGEEKLKRWKSRSVRLISDRVHPDEGQKLQDKRLFSFSYIDPLSNIPEEADLYRAFLESLKVELEEHPEDVLPSGTAEHVTIPTTKAPGATMTRTVFIVHGHDDANKLRLEKLLAERWGLKPLILSYTAGKGRTLIEKFEEEAETATYALVLLTPDDQVMIRDDEYAQARPNVIFELGWFYGRLGREKVCILFKRGTKIHSDLDGITLIEFNDSVEEKVLPAFPISNWDIGGLLW